MTDVVGKMKSNDRFTLVLLVSSFLLDLLTVIRCGLVVLYGLNMFVPFFAASCDEGVCLPRRCLPLIKMFTLVSLD